MEVFSIFAYVAALLLVALLSTRLMRLIKLPNVTGYILTGIIMGPFLFGLLFNNFSFDGIKDGTVYKFVTRLGFNRGFRLYCLFHWYII